MKEFFKNKLLKIMMIFMIIPFFNSFFSFYLIEKQTEEEKETALPVYKKPEPKQSIRKPSPKLILAKATDNKIGEFSFDSMKDIGTPVGSVAGGTIKLKPYLPNYVIEQVQTEEGTNSIVISFYKNK